MVDKNTTTRYGLSINWDFARLASDEQIERAARALEENGINTLIAQHGEEAEKMVLDLLPEGAEVFTASSQTLEQLGIPASLEQSEQYDLVRDKLKKMDKKTQQREMEEMGATPEYIIGSVHAVTEDGQILVASNTGSQLAPYAASAANVIWVVGAQKIVRDMDEATRRIEEYAYPREDERLREAMGVPSAVNKVLWINKEIRPGRVTMIIVKEDLGY
ncbi:MAG TPA: LUD domain-containing protein [Anaerolineales bacterium]|nr:LUD domain-containing protein [Anaerolineales bacterium]